MRVIRGLSKNFLVNSVLAISWVLFWSLYASLFYIQTLALGEELNSAGLVYWSLKALSNMFQKFFHIESVYLGDLYNELWFIVVQNGYFLVSIVALWLFCSRREWRMAIEGIIAFFISVIVGSISLCIINLLIGLSLDMNYFVLAYKADSSLKNSAISSIQGWPIQIARIEAWLLFLICAVVTVLAIKHAAELYFCD